jgi:hypothetical protein
MKRTKKPLDPVSFRPSVEDAKLIKELRKVTGAKKRSVVIREGLLALAREKGL